MENVLIVHCFVEQADLVEHTVKQQEQQVTIMSAHKNTHLHTHICNTHSDTHHIVGFYKKTFI